MDLKPLPPRLTEGRDFPKTQRRASFSAMKALRLRSLSISSQISSSSEGDPPSPITTRRRTLTKNRTFETLKEDLIRRPSKSSTEDNTERASVSTRPTSPSGTGSRSNSVYGDSTTVIKSGPLQPESSILKSRKEFLVLTPLALIKFRSRSAAVDRFPQISASNTTISALSPVDSSSSLKDYGASRELYVPLEKIVSAFNDEGTRPSFGIEVWWSDQKKAACACLQLDFSLPNDRDEWLKQIRHAIKTRTKSILEEPTPSDVELQLKQVLGPQQKDDQVEIYPVIPRRPYVITRANSNEIKKGWRDNSSFYIAFAKNICILAQFIRTSAGQKVNPSLVQFGLVTLSKVNIILNDERFDLVFR